MAAIAVTLVVTGEASGQVATAPSACVPTQPLAETNGAPDALLLSTLAVLRRPATPPDALPRQVQLFGGMSVFRRYVRRARVVASRSYYVVPAHFSGCGGTALKAHDGIALVCVLRAGQRIVESGVGGESSATQVRQHGLFLVGGSCLHTSHATLIAGVLPDGVASITLRYAASTVTLTAAENIVAAAVPKAGGPLDRPLSMTWRAADGTIIKTVTGPSL